VFIGLAVTSHNNSVASEAIFSNVNVSAPSDVPNDQGWIPLFNNQNLAGWYSWLPSTGRNNDPQGVFKVHDGMIHILDLPVTNQNQEHGYIATNSEYSNYRLRLQYKWGQKRFPPRANDKRDSGLLYHFVGPDTIWPSTIECQIQEGDTGDFWLIEKTNLTTTVESLGGSPKQYKAGGLVYNSQNSSYEQIVKSGTYDSLTDWNTVEIVVSGNDAVHIVNGVVNNRGTNLRQTDPNNPSSSIPLTSGRILLQAEGAEIFYRNIEIKPLVYPTPPPNSIVLFNGASTSQWQPRNGGGPIQWPIVDGALEVCPGCGDIRTTQMFQDFKLHAEFRVPAVEAGAAEQDRGNSGIYLQQRYEVQVLDSFGGELSGTNDVGAIYGIRDADSNASLPAEAWQTYDITFRAARWSGGTKIENARVTVVLNGTVVQNNVEIPFNTALGDVESPAPGPVMLQEHGNRVRYRNVWIEPLSN
jgi:hypothetical protein